MLQELRVPAHRPAESLEKRCERIYRSWGLSTYDANKRYLTGALRMMMGSDHRLAIRKEILGPVAERNTISPWRLWTAPSGGCWRRWTRPVPRHGGIFEKSMA